MQNSVDNAPKTILNKKALSLEVTGTLKGSLYELLSHYENVCCAISKRESGFHVINFKNFQKKVSVICPTTF